MHQHRTPEQDAADEQLDVAWRTHAPAAMRFATAVVGPVDAHDVTTTAFLRVTQQPDWTHIEHLDRYLIRAVRNEAQHLYRQRRRRWQRDLLAVRPEATTDPLPDVDLPNLQTCMSDAGYPDFFNRDAEPNPFAEFRAQPGVQQAERDMANAYADCIIETDFPTTYVAAVDAVLDEFDEEYQSELTELRVERDAALQQARTILIDHSIDPFTS